MSAGKTIRIYKAYTIESSSENTLDLALRTRGIKAKTRLTDDGIVVLAASHTSGTVTDSLSNGYKKFRGQLIENGVLEQSKGGYVFTKTNYLKVRRRQQQLSLVIP